MKCSVKNCPFDSEREENVMNFYTYPDLDKKNAQKWKTLLKIDHDIPIENLIICERHFPAGWAKKKRRKYLPNNKMTRPTGSVETASSSEDETTASEDETNGLKQQLKRPRMDIVTVPEHSKASKIIITSVRSLNKSATDTRPSETEISRSFMTMTEEKIPEQQKKIEQTKRPEPVDPLALDDFIPPSPPSDASTDEEAEPTRLSSRAKVRRLVNVREPMSLERAMLSSSQSSDSSSPRKFIRQKKLHFLRKKVNTLQAQLKWQSGRITQLSYLVNKLTKMQLLDVELEHRLSLIPGAAPNIFRRLVYEKKMPYSAEEKKFAMTLNFYAPRTYDYVRTEFGLALPETKYIAEWYKYSKGQPGFCKEAFEAIKVAQINSIGQLFVQLSFDEISIRQTDWNTARPFVFDDGICKETEQDQVKEVLVFLATSINANWKIALGYFPSSGLSAEQKANLIKLCLINLIQFYVEVVGLTCYGTRSNYAVLKILGCNMNDEALQSTFHVEKKILSAYPDPIHLMKLVRNSFAECRVLINGYGDRIDWDYLKELLKLQEEQQRSQDVRIRKALAHFANQKINIKLAVETLNLSIVNALRYCEMLQLPQFRGCKPTAEFIEILNGISSGLTKPINKENVDKVLESAEDAIIYLRSLEDANQVKLVNSSWSLGYMGLIVCLKNLPRIYNATVEDNMTNLPMSKLTQQHIEAYFAGCRSPHWKNNPTFPQFRSNFKRLLDHGVRYCIPLEVKEIHSVILDASLVDLEDEGADKSLQEEKNLLENYRNIFHYQSSSIFADELLYYVAAFIVRQLQQQLKCDRCSALLEGGWRRSCQIWYNKLGYLRYPSASVFEICKLAERTLRAIAKRYNNAEFNRIKRQVRRDCFDLKIFTEDTNTLHVIIHRLLLIDAVSEKYVFMRFFYKNLNSQMSKHHRPIVLN